MKLGIIDEVASISEEVTLYPRSSQQRLREERIIFLLLGSEE